MIKKYLKQKCMLNPNTMVVGGVSRGIVLDLERNTFMFIPVDLFNILHTLKSGFVIQKIIDQFSEGENDNEKIILNYFTRLYKADLLTFTDFSEYYMSIDTAWDYPGHVSNAIIDINNQTEHLPKILNELTDLGCRCPAPRQSVPKISRESTNL